MRNSLVISQYGSCIGGTRLLREDGRKQGGGVFGPGWVACKEFLVFIPVIQEKDHGCLQFLPEDFVRCFGAIEVVAQGKPDKAGLIGKDGQSALTGNCRGKSLEFME